MASAPRARRWRRRLALAAAVLVGALALAAWQHELWLEPLLVRVVQREARAALGGELTLEQLTLTRTGLEARGVRWRAERGPLRALDEARLTLATDWRAELRGEARRAWTLEGRGLALALEPADAGAAAPRLPDLGRVELVVDGLTVSGLLAAPLHVERAEARGVLSGEELALEQALLVSGPNRVELRAARARLLAEPRATFDSLRGELALTLGDLRALPELGSIVAPLESAELTLQLEEGQATVAGHLGLEGGQLVLERGLLRHAGHVDWRELECELALSADLRDLAPFSRWAGRPLAGRWSGAVTVAGPLVRPVGRFLGRGEALRIDGLALDSAEIDLETDGERVSLTTCRALGPSFRGHVSGELSLHPLVLRELTVAARAEGPALATLLPFPAEHAFLGASLSGDPSAPDGSFEASLSGALLAGTALQDIEARGTLAGGTVRFDELQARGAGAELSAGGLLRRQADGFEAELERLTLAWGDLACELESGARASFGPGRVSLEKLVLQSHSPGGDGRAELSAEVDGARTRAHLECRAFDLGSVLARTFLGGWYAGATSGTLDYTRAGAAEALAFELDVSAARRGSEDDGLRLVTRGEARDGRVTLDRLELTQGALHVAGSLALPFTPREPLALGSGPVALALTLACDDLARLGALGFGVPPAKSGPLTARLELGGSWNALVGRGELAVRGLVLDGPPRPKLDGRLAFELGDVLRPTLELTSDVGHVELTGTLGLGGDLVALRADPSRLLEIPLGLTAEFALSDLAWLAQELPDLRRLSGAVTGHLGMAGTVQDPLLDGRLVLRDGELRLARFAAPLRALQGEFRLAQDVVHVEALSGELGGSPVRLSGTLEPFGPFTRLDLRLQGENLLLARSSRLRLRADADLDLSGSPELLRVGGELVLTEGAYESEFDVLKEILRVGRRTRDEAGRPPAFARSGNLARTEFDVHVRSKRRFRYQTNVLSADLRPDAYLRGTGAAPTAEGTVYVDAAELVLPSGNMQLESGLLTFRPEQPFRPELALTAGMRVQRHDVRATVAGTLDELEIEPTSSPPLARDDLWVLILTGQLPTDRWQDRSAAAMESLAVFLARDQFVRWFGGDSEGLLDRFEIELGARTTQSGQPTGRVLFYMKPRQVGASRATYLSAEVDEYERVNYALGIVFRPR